MANFPFHIEFERLRPPRRPMNQRFPLGPGLGMSPMDFMSYLTMPMLNVNDYHQGVWQNLTARDQDASSTIKEYEDKFQINIDVQHFKAKEITVKIVDGFIVVVCKHDEREDCHGFISRNFTRRYPLPEGVNPELVVSKLSSDGVLTITAPRNVPSNNSDERIVPIVRTGPVKTQRGGAEQ